MSKIDDVDRQESKTDERKLRREIDSVEDNAQITSTRIAEVGSSKEDDPGAGI